MKLLSWILVSFFSVWPESRFMLLALIVKEKASCQCPYLRLLEKKNKKRIQVKFFELRNINIIACIICSYIQAASDYIYIYYFFRVRQTMFYTFHTVAEPHRDLCGQLTTHVLS